MGSTITDLVVITFIGGNESCGGNEPVSKQPNSKRGKLRMFRGRNAKFELPNKAQKFNVARPFFWGVLRIVHSTILLRVIWVDVCVCRRNVESLCLERKSLSGNNMPFNTRVCSSKSYQVNWLRCWSHGYNDVLRDAMCDSCVPVFYINCLYKLASTSLNVTNSHSLSMLAYAWDVICGPSVISFYSQHL